MEIRTTTTGRTASRWVTAVLIVVVLSGMIAQLVVQLRLLDAAIALAVDKDRYHVQRVLDELVDDALVLATLIAQDPTLVTPLSSEDRPALLDRFEEPFEVLRRDHGVTHLHFAVPPATSLLRVHAPDTFGDDLTPYRPMLAEAVATGRPLAGLERGRFGASARAVVPVRSSQGAVDSWLASGAQPTRVVGVVDLGYSLDDVLLSQVLAGSDVAVVTLPSAAVAETLERDDPALVSSTLDPSIRIVADTQAASLALVDGELADLVSADRRRWRLSRIVIHDHTGVPAAVVLVASDVSGAWNSRLLAITTTVAMLLVLAAVAGVLGLMRRRGQRTLDRATSTMMRSGQVSRALRLADTEEETLRVLDRALDHYRGEDVTRVLLADSSRAHVTVVVDHGFGPGGGVLPTPGRCPATRTGEIQRFTDPDALDACPYLLNGGCTSPEEVTGTLRCQPISIHGATIGVLQFQTRTGRVDRHLDHQLDDLVRQTGDHLSVVRAQVESLRQAGTDPLTGVANRRRFDEEVSTRLRTGQPYALLFLDIDRFKDLNDVHGHDVGDRALRLFAGVLRGSLRPEDLVARYGGEEFVVFIDGCDRDQAALAAERVRGDLALALTAGGVPGFTVSIGVADHRATSSPFDTQGFDTVLTAADEALLHAKRTGRNRVVLHPTTGYGPPSEDVTTAPWESTQARGEAGDVPAPAGSQFSR